MSAQADIVIITWNDPPQMLERSVASALAAGRVANVIVVDNGSEPPARCIDGVGVWHRSDGNLGVARGRNLGASLGSAPAICFLDSDAELLPEALQRLLDVLEDGVAVSAPVFVGQAPEASAGVAPTFLRKIARVLGATSAYRPTPRRGTSWEVDFAIGACLLVKRNMFEELDGFDEQYFYGPEDVDMCLRVKARGGAVRQVGTALCVHPPRRRYRVPLNRQGMRHAVAVLRHLRRHRPRGRNGGR